ncbi:MAG: addiction module protein [Burkholderiaceae bacterium]
MNRRIERIEARAMGLSSEDRAELAGRLIASLAVEELSASWRDEVARRLADYDAGRVHATCMDEVMERLEGRVRRPR